MGMKKLVKLDESLRLTEIDPKVLRRSALALKAYIEQAPEAEAEKYEYEQRVMPLVRAALDGTVQIPYYGQQPYSMRFIIEGLYPELIDEFSKLYSNFMLIIEGSSAKFSLSTHLHGKYVLDECEEVINGERYEWCWFED